MRIRGMPRIAVIGLLVAATSACATKTVVERPVGPPANADVAAPLVVDQFLRAVNSNDLDAMARLFGTRDGSVLKRDPKQAVDRQMFALASILRHQSYAVTGTEIVPGRREEATRVNVRMNIGGRDVDVPYTMVYSTGGTWLIEQIGIERITTRR